MLGIISRLFLHCIVSTYQNVTRVFGYANEQKGVFVNGDASNTDNIYISGYYKVCEAYQKIMHVERCDTYKK